MQKVFVLLCALFSLATTTAIAAPTLGPVLGAQQWLNGRPHVEAVRGKVVIVDVFTFDCINCKHVVPELRTLYRTTSRNDLEIIGVHTPETSYEHVRTNVIANLGVQGIVWPVAIDNEHVLWNAYGIEYWPSQLIFDRRGVLRKTIIGEGQDAEVSALIKTLIAER